MTQLSVDDIEPLYGVAQRGVPLSESVANDVRDLVMSGRLRPGDVIAIDRLAETLGVSNTPVREALQILKVQGIVILEPRKGFRVARISRQDIEDLYTVHSGLAGELTRRAAVNIDADGLRLIERVQSEMQAASVVKDPLAMEQLNAKLHSVLYQVADSPKLVWLLQITRAYLPRHFYSTMEGWSESVLSEHEEIIDALRRRDADSAAAAMESHIRRGGEVLVKFLETTGFWADIKE